MQGKVEEYYVCVSRLVMKQLLLSYPSDLSRNKKEEINWKKIDQHKNPLYAALMFNTLEWWKEVGVRTYPEVSVAAFIVLGKQHHNGFQERVFSRGTFTDDNLRKRLKEKTFEMCVLESLNLENVEKYENILEKNNNSDVPELIMNEIKHFFNNKNNEVQYNEFNELDSDSDDDDIILDPVERLAKDIESGYLENVKSEDTNSGSESDNELEDMLDGVSDNDDTLDRMSALDATNSTAI